MIDYLEGLNAELPQSDWDDFLSRKAAHDVAAKRRRGLLTAAISIPAAAAALLLLFLLPIHRTPAGQMAQNNPEPPQEELQVPADSISNPADSVILGGILAEPELIENKVAMMPSVTTVRMSNDTVSFNHDIYKQQLDSMLVQNNMTKEELDSITAAMMERVTAYEQTKEPSNTNITYGSLGMTTGATGDVPLSESNLNFGGFGGFGGSSSLRGITPPEMPVIISGDPIRGYVYSSDEAKFVSGIFVDEINTSGVRLNGAVTDEKGYFSFNCIDPHDSVYVHAEGYEPVTLPMFGIIYTVNIFSLNAADSVFVVVSNMPEFPGGMGQALTEYLNTREYPADALKDSIEGSVIVEFIIEKDGSITNANVIKGVCPSIDAEAVRIISDMPKWKPGSDMRRPRRVRYRLAVDFYLDVGSTQQDDIFGLRIGMPVSEQEIVNLFSERYNAQVDIPSREASIVYHVRDIPYLGFDWNHVFLYVDKDDNTLKSVELNLIVPHNFDFAPTKEDSINIVTAKVGEALDNQYGEPTRNFGGTVWHGPNDVDIVLGIDRSARTAVSDPRREGLTTEAMIIQVLYLNKDK